MPKKSSVQNSEDRIHCFIAHSCINHLFSCFLKSLLTNTVISTSAPEVCAISRRKKKTRRGRVKSLPQDPRNPFFRQDSARMLRFFKVKGLKWIKCGEHVMASTPYRGHLWVDDQASLWLSSYLLRKFYPSSPDILHESSATAHSLFPVRAECQEQQQ